MNRELRFERLIQASPARVFDLIQDFRAWKEWSPWEKLDPNMTATHSGAPTDPTISSRSERTTAWCCPMSFL